ncbi:hypothetical protein IG604_21925 [Vibrio cholerae]|nr:hypothetical protein [Vibrio cholerae]
MDDAKSLIIGVIGGIITIVFVFIFKKIRAKSLKNDIEILELEIKTLEKMKKSSIEMNRVLFRGIYALLFLFGLINSIERFFDNLQAATFDTWQLIFSVGLWSTFTYVAYIWWKRTGMFSEFNKSVEALSAQKDKKQKSLSQLK